MRPKHGRQKRPVEEFCATESHSTIISVGMCVVMTSILDAIGVDTGCGSLRGSSERIAVAAIVVDVFQIEGMNVTGEVAVGGNH